MGPAWIAPFAVVTALFAAVSWGIWRDAGWNWLSIGMTFATVFVGFGSMIECLLLRIELTDDALIMTDLRGRRRYEIADIERISEAKGVPPALRLRNGQRVILPSVGSSVGNSVRAWLKQAGRA
jgi:hypothetical protein